MAPDPATPPLPPRRRSFGSALLAVRQAAKRSLDRLAMACGLLAREAGEAEPAKRPSLPRKARPAAPVVRRPRVPLSLEVCLQIRAIIRAWLCEVTPYRSLPCTLRAWFMSGTATLPPPPARLQASPEDAVWCEALQDELYALEALDRAHDRHRPPAHEPRPARDDGGCRTLKLGASPTEESWRRPPHAWPPPHAQPLAALAI
jgi:hypothetical protein